MDSRAADRERLAQGESKTSFGVGGGDLVLAKTGRKVCRKLKGRVKLVGGVLRGVICRGTARARERERESSGLGWKRGRAGGAHGREKGEEGRNGGSDVNTTAASINVTSVITGNLREGLLVRQYAYTWVFERRTEAGARSKGIGRESNRGGRGGEEGRTRGSARVAEWYGSHFARWDGSNCYEKGAVRSRFTGILQRCC